MIFTRLLLLFGAHWLADIALQTDFIARGKNRRTAIAGIPWWQVMAAHAGIHMLFVLLVTGSCWFAVAEFVLHYAIDCAKCEGWFDDGEKAYNIDQALHFACKIAWVLI